MIWDYSSSVLQSKLHGALHRRSLADWLITKGLYSNGLIPDHEWDVLVNQFIEDTKQALSLALQDQD